MSKAVTSYFRHSIILLLIKAFTVSAGLQAQDMNVALEEISIIGSRKSAYSQDHQLISLDSASLFKHPASDLGELLTLETNLNITRYGGHGSLSSIRLRGSAPAHTQVNWNGIPLNSTTTGMADLGLIPGSMSSRVEIVNGASGAQFGNSTFGGAINLENRPEWNNRFKMRGFTEVGSWNHVATGLFMQTGTQRFQYQFDGIVQSSPNRYPYHNTFKAGQPLERRSNDSLARVNAQQHFFFRLPGHWFIQAGSWVYAREKALPAAASSTPNLFAHQTDQGARHYLKVNKWTDKHYFELLAARFDDSLNYSERLVVNDALTSSSGIRTSSTFLSASHRWNTSSSFSLESGADLELQQAATGSFAEPVSEWRSALYILTRLNHKGLKGSAGIRQELNNGHTSWPLISMYASYPIINDLSIRTSFSNKRRIPNLNEKYWKPGGNPDLLSESGFGGDFGLAWNGILMNRFTAHFSLNLFAQEINNWIQWLPTGTYWSPMNIRKVRCQGWEAEWGNTLQLRLIRLKTSVLYTYTESLDMSRSSIQDRLDRQLAYVPLHTLRTQMSVEHGAWDGTAVFGYRGMRHTTDVHDQYLDLPGYFLADVQIGYHLALKKSELICRLKIDNLFNASYETIRGYPSPGRSFLLMLVYSFQQINNQNQ